MEPEQVERELTLEAAPDEVWRLLVDAEGLESWLAADAQIDARPGGEARFRMPDGERRDGFVEEAEAPRRLVLWWSAASEEASRVEFTLEPVEDGTRLRVVESRPLRRLDVYGPEVVLGGGEAGPRLRAAALA